VQNSGNKKHITREDIAVYQETMLTTKSKAGKYFSKSTVNRYLSYCRAAFHKAGVKPNPFAKFDVFREVPRTRFLNKEELKALLSEVENSPNIQLPGIVTTAIMTGLRKKRYFETTCPTC
jgi:integrase